jgi:septal ring factor EnvC (AmiA/AmiB activator)
VKYKEPLSLENRALETTRRKKKRTNKSGLILLFLIIWGGLFAGGFYFTKNYFDRTINNIQQTNALNIQMIKERLDSLTNELLVLKSEISTTDQTLSSTGNIQAELSKKIEILDAQLKNLEKSLRILKEAP